MRGLIRGAFWLALLCASAGVLASVPSPSRLAGFQPNVGQMDDRVAYWTEHEGVSLFVTRQGELVHRFAGNDGQDWVLVERMGNANPLQPSALDVTTSRISAITSDGTQSAASTHRIALGKPWQGIHAELWLGEDGFEKRFELAPGADVAHIRVALDGANQLHIADSGELTLTTGLGDVVLSAPVAWQDIDGQHQPVDVRYTNVTHNGYGFALGAYDPRHAVTIDPIIRSTFSGGNSDESIDSLKVGTDSVYVTGGTRSANFPGTTGGYQPAIDRNTTLGGNLFIARYSLDLTTLIQATYFGSHGPSSGGQSSSLQVRTLVVADDSIYITGSAPGEGTHLPTTAGALQTTPGGGTDDAYVARLSLDLTQLLQATYFGGADRDNAWPMVVTADGVFISGWSNETGLAGLANGAVNTAPVPSGTGAAFVAKLSRDLSTALATTWINTGGWSADPRAMTVGTDGSIYVGGDGRPSLFETTGAYQPAIASTSPRTDGFVVRLSADLGTIHRSTFLGGSDYERIDSLAFGESTVFVGGSTDSNVNFPFPPTAADTTHSKGSSFVAALSADLSALNGASSYSGNDVLNSTSTAGIAFHDGKLFLAGTTRSGTLPGSTGGAEPSNTINAICGFAAVFNSALTTIHQGSFLGCGDNRLQVFAMDVGNDLLYVAGWTRRNQLPNGEGSAQPNKGGGVEEAYIIAATTDLAGPKPNADIAVEKTGSDERIANRYIRYEVIVRNLGPDDAVDVLVQDILPDELDAATWQCSGFDGASCAASSGSGDLSETVSIPNGGRLEYSICGRADSLPSLVVNTAQADVASHTLDPVAANNSDSTTMIDPRLFADGFEDADLPPWCPPTN
ncbi:MAG: DUF11 domain-containing protein [Lysobacteraceae bacterium]